MIKLNLQNMLLTLNNLYGYAMSEYLLYGGFKWVKTTNETVNKH